MGALERLITKHFGGVPKSFRDLEWIIRARADVPPILVKADQYRVVSPGSQPDYHLVEEQKLSKNYYFTRDTRRAYPQTVVYTANDIQKLLPEGVEIKQIGAKSTNSVSATATSAESHAAFTPSHLPPIINKKYHWTKSSPHLDSDAGNPDFSIRGAN
ncbi:hypothetical protein DFS34DRAFT_638165 [Phlyctochytrium arcticum]|nr:hypothetical protein DFS34DRAFT_638165 [Phlyctochytrium arcticum]